MQLPHVQVSPWPTLSKVPATNLQANSSSGRKPLHFKPLLSSNRIAMSLVGTAYVPETS
jgi:hypothetical protein